ncbi:glycosyltransferase [Lipingzhangella sp. LS1_29]|uniref:Glycosyltransferase n=1 Tax=Lipingzhangella rawalii TaxID=2055835 RepID=A0ABU2H2N0_9ACTN|nr:glycosyltransferase [Lipingzhangella rawalii]MDS1269564.1 glycosyltransferase [Lipingzhangella rawalii]
MTLTERVPATTGSQQPHRDPARPLLRRNDYSALRPPELGTWEPTLDVSVVIPARGCQHKLDLTLAALAAQTYPAHLMQVIVVDDGADGSSAPLHLPEIRPERTVLLPAGSGWGSAHAVNTGVAAAEGTVLLRLDADMLTYHDHVESQLRWHHLADYVAVLGHKRFVEPGQLDPEHVYDRVRRGEASQLFDQQQAEAHWVERYSNARDQLRTAGHMAYHVFVGATGSLRRALFDAAGGMDPAMVLGGDTEFAYRVGQTGAVFVPDPDSSSWHLGRSQMQSRRDEGTAVRHPYVANRVPLLESRRRTRGRQWEVPYVDILLDVTGLSTGMVSAADVRPTVEALLDGDLTDVRITLVGDFSELGSERRAPLDEPLREVRLVHETFRAESRVRFHTADPDPQVTFRLFWPATLRPSRSAVRILTEEANRQGAGLLCVTGAGATPRLERTAAFARAAHLAGRRRGDPADPELDALVADVYGLYWMHGTEGSQGRVFTETGDDAHESEEPPADWRTRLDTATRRAEREKQRADRLERRIRWATRTHPRRLLRRLFLWRNGR